MVSFLLFTVNSFSSTRSSQSADHIAQHLNSKQDAINDGSSQQLSEKNETENDESNFELQALALPFLISYFHFEVSAPLSVSVQPLTEKTAHPIYVSVCNFRI